MNDSDVIEKLKVIEVKSNQVLIVKIKKGTPDSVIHELGTNLLLATRGFKFTVNIVIEQGDYIADIYPLAEDGDTVEEGYTKSN